MNSTRLSLAAALAGIALAAGCTKEPAGPTTMPAMATTKPVVAAPAVPDKMTHKVAVEQPYFTKMPMAGAKPAGTLKAGTKVMMVIPGANSQVETADGMLVYTPRDGLELLVK